MNDALDRVLMLVQSSTPSSALRFAQASLIASVSRRKQSNKGAVRLLYRPSRDQQALKHCCNTLSFAHCRLVCNTNVHKCDCSRTRVLSDCFAEPLGDQTALNHCYSTLSVDQCRLVSKPNQMCIGVIAAKQGCCQTALQSRQGAEKSQTLLQYSGLRLVCKPRVHRCDCKKTKSAVILFVEQN